MLDRREQVMQVAGRGLRPLLLAEHGFEAALSRRIERRRPFAVAAVEQQNGSPLLSRSTLRR